MNIKWPFLIIKFIVGPPTSRGRCQKLTSSIPPGWRPMRACPYCSFTPGFKGKIPAYTVCVYVCVRCFVNGRAAKASTRVCAVCKYKTGLYTHVYIILYGYTSHRRWPARNPRWARRRRPGENHLTSKTPILSRHQVYRAINFTISYIPINIIYTIRI